MTTFAEEAAAFIEKAAANPNPEQAAVYKKAQEHVEAQGILDKALNVGDTIPDFSLPDATGKTVSITDVLATGPAVISFYRGSWCPFCNMELRGLQQQLARADAANVTLVAISPNTPDESLSLTEKNGLTFPVLSDAENALAKQFNLVFEMEEGLVEFYKKAERNIDQMNGSENWELPVPATYVVGQDRKIAWAYVDLNHRARAEPADVVNAAIGLSSNA